MTSAGRPFSAATAAQLEGDYYRYHQRLAEQLAALRYAIEQLGADPPKRLAALLRSHREDPRAAAQLASVTWALVQAHEALMGALERAARLAGLNPTLKPMTSNETISALRDSRQVAKPVINALTELNRRRNDLVHEFPTVTPDKLLATIQLTLHFGRYTESFAKLMAAAGLTPQS
ncbi:hypothetical protein AYO39_00175 [Actinobacteria bacterium SCGC AG-212-D09]|nr:hypothetical protein AYO39_00175 [Actinobacteria bacterium SCGC AG-212-D09]